MSTPAPSSNLQELAQLVRDAFATAAAAGRSPDEMSIAVLKNQLLLNTKRQFNELDYGARTFTRLLEKLPDLVELDTTRRPAIVHLKSATPKLAVDDTASTEADLRRLRVRSDLWDAVFDQSGTRYTWDASSQRVREANDEDIAPSLPSLDRAQLDSERASFVERHWTSDEGGAWVAHGGSVKSLPSHLRGLWTEQLKRVVVGLLKAWFSEREEQEPADLLVVAGVRPTRPGAPSALTDAEGTRRFALAVVAGMTDAELAMLQLPASAVARVWSR